MLQGLYEQWSYRRLTTSCLTRRARDEFGAAVRASRHDGATPAKALRRLWRRRHAPQRGLFTFPDLIAASNHVALQSYLSRLSARKTEVAKFSNWPLRQDPYGSTTAPPLEQEDRTLRSAPGLQSRAQRLVPRRVGNRTEKPGAASGPRSGGCSCQPAFGVQPSASS